MEDQNIPALPPPQNDDNDNNNNNQENGPIMIRQPRPGAQINYDEHFPEDPLPATERRRRQASYRAPIGFNYADRDAVNYTLKNLVSSKKARDIVRSANFMPGQFDVWNEKPTGGNRRYQGGLEDLDGDNIDEFVVRRDGQIVAVNGYTTKASDAPFKNMYWSVHPTKERRKEEPYRNWLHNTYYGPTYNDDYSEITAWANQDPTEDAFRSKYRRHVTHAPTKFSPYRAFSQFIVAPACKQAFLILGNNNAEKAKVVRQTLCERIGKKAVEASFSSEYYDTNVKIPFLNSIANQLNALRAEFIDMKRRSNPEFQEDWRDGSDCSKKFEQWLFNKAAVKTRISNYVHNMLTTQKDATIAAVRNNLVQSCRTLSGFLAEVETAWQRKSTAVMEAMTIGD